MHEEEIKKVCKEVQDTLDQFPEDTKEQKDIKEFIHTYYEILWEAYNTIRRKKEDERLDRIQMNIYPRIISWNKIGQAETRINKMENVRRMEPSD